MQSIGRFKVSKRLGAGSRGSVWLGVDPELERPVAIKLLEQPWTTGAAQQRFLAAARAVGQIQHPGIVSIFDAGQQAGRPYLVFEYVQGETLSEWLSRPKIDLQQGLDLFTTMLSAIEEAHQRGVVHGDLKPAHIRVTSEGVPKILDFVSALAFSNAPEAIPDSSLGYLAPEGVAAGEGATQADVYSLGAILFDVLTGGRPLLAESDRQKLMPGVDQRNLVRPSRINPEVGQRLDAIVLKALESEPQARFRDAGELRTALLECRESSDGQSGGSRGTVEFLLRRMQHQSDFPVLSESIRTLNRLALSEREDISRLASVTIRDFALTNKILKVVNSAYYSRFAGKIGTVSRAIVILGVKTIRSVAASLIFFEHLHNKTQASKLKNEIAAAIFSATLARQVAEAEGTDLIEETFLAAMLHNLGRILITFYLPEESGEIERLTGQEGLTQVQAEKKVLGLSFEEVGIAVASQWNFPEDIRRGMIRVDPAAPGNLKNRERKMRLIAGFANDAAQVVGNTEPGEEQPVKALLGRYQSSLAIDDQQFDQLLESTSREFREFSSSFSGEGGGTEFLQRLAARGSSKPPAKSDVSEAVILNLQEGVETELAPADIKRGVPSPDAEAILTKGLQEVTAMLLEEKIDLNQLFNVVLETVYRAMAFQRVLLCLQDASKREFSARLGFGSDIDEFMAGFRFSNQFSADVFHAALKNGVDLYIADTREPKILGNIPQWYTAISKAGSFLLFPLVVDRRPLGMIYSDHPSSRGMELSGGQLDLLKALRNQLVLAVKSSRSG